MEAFKFFVLFIGLMCSNFAFTASHFLDLCESQDRDARIVAERVLKKPVTGAGDCQAALQEIMSQDELNLSCGEYEVKCEVDQRMHQIDSLQEFAHLSYLNIDNHLVEEIGPVAHMPLLEFLEMNGNPVADLGPLKALTELRELSLANNPKLNDASLAEYMAVKPDLYVLYLNDTSITDLGFIEGMEHLTMLDVSYTLVRDIGQLNLNRDWIALFLDGLDIPDLGVLQAMPRLRILTANDNQLGSLEAVKQHPGLQILSVENNHLIDIIPVARLSFLQFLYVGQNQIRNIEPIQVMRGMFSIDLSENRISDLSPMRFLGLLIKAEVEGNPVTGAECLEQLQDYSKKALICNQLLTFAKPQRPSHRDLLHSLESSSSR